MAEAMEVNPDCFIFPNNSANLPDSCWKSRKLITVIYLTKHKMHGQKGERHKKKCCYSVLWSLLLVAIVGLTALAIVWACQSSAVHGSSSSSSRTNPLAEAHRQLEEHFHKVCASPEALRTTQCKDYAAILAKQMALMGK